MSDLSRKDFVVDDLDRVHLRSQWQTMCEKLSPHWRGIIGRGRELDAVQALDALICEAYCAAKDRDIGRWSDDGGRS